MALLSYEQWPNGPSLCFVLLILLVREQRDSAIPVRLCSFEIVLETYNLLISSDAVQSSSKRFLSINSSGLPFWHTNF